MKFYPHIKDFKKHGIDLGIIIMNHGPNAEQRLSRHLKTRKSLGSNLLLWSRACLPGIPYFPEFHRVLILNSVWGGCSVSFHYVILPSVFHFIEREKVKDLHSLLPSRFLTILRFIQSCLFDPLRYCLLSHHPPRKLNYLHLFPAHCQITNYLSSLSTLAVLFSLLSTFHATSFPL